MEDSPAKSPKRKKGNAEEQLKDQAQTSCKAKMESFV